jgi:hypothetical protein
MTRDELDALLARLTLPATLEGVRWASDYRIEVTQWEWVNEAEVREGPLERRFAIQLCKWRMDVDTGRWGWGKGGMYLLEPNISPSGVVLRVFKALLAYEEHELREGGLLLDGVNVLDPHPVLTDSW